MSISGCLSIVKLPVIRKVNIPKGLASGEYGDDLQTLSAAKRSRLHCAIRHDTKDPRICAVSPIR